MVQTFQSLREMSDTKKGEFGLSITWRKTNRSQTTKTKNKKEEGKKRKKIAHTGVYSRNGQMYKNK